MHDADLRLAGAILEIDLAAIRESYRSLRERTRGACAAVVTANAYRLGAATVAPSLYAEGARVAARVVPVLNSLGQVDAWVDVARRKGRFLPAEVHLDSGMSRMGLNILQDCPVFRPNY